MDKFWNYVMGIMGPLLLQMVEVKGGTDTETGGLRPQWIVLAVSLPIILCLFNLCTQLCQICCEHYMDELQYGFRSLKEETEESIV